MMLAITRDALREEYSKQVNEQSQQIILQHNMKTSPALHLHYVDTVMTIKTSAIHHTKLNILSVLHFVTETRTLSIVYFTFGSMFHLSYTSLASPKRPLTLHHMPSIPSKKLCKENVKSGRRVDSKSDGKCSKLMASRSTHRNDQPTSVRKTTLASDLPSTATKGCWLSRRHSISVPNPSPCLLPSKATNGRILARRHSIGVSPGKCAFPATIMYSKIVSHLETNLQSSCHFCHLQRFNNCFFGHRMVNCLLAYCLASLNSCITKEKAAEMCKHLLIHGVIENVSHRKQQETEGTVFKCGRLYRFTGNHFWEDKTTCISELDGATSASMPSLDISSSRKKPRQSGFRRMRTSLSARKASLVRSCRIRLGSIGNRV